MYFIIEGKPQGKQRPRHTRRGVTYTPDETRNYEKMVALKYKQAKGELLGGTIKLILEIYYPIPASETKGNKILMASNIKRPDKKPDIDNVIKIIMDGLNGVAYHDDKQIISIVANKYYSNEPRVEVSVYEL